MARPAASALSGGVPGAGLLTFHAGGRVMHRTVLHPIFWAPAGFSFPTGYEATVQQYLVDIAQDSGLTTNVFATTGEYADASGVAAYDITAGGSFDDTTAFPANSCFGGGTTCIVDAALQTEVHAVATAQSIAPSTTDLYVLFLPPNATTCFDGTNITGTTQCSANSVRHRAFCGYHAAMGSLSSPEIYAVMPYPASTGCGTGGTPNSTGADPLVDYIISVTSHEVAEAMTDPLLDAWYSDSSNPSGNENGDNCNQVYGTALGGAGTSAWNQVVNGHTYFTQTEWVNEAGGSCVQTYTNPLQASLQAPASAPARASVTFSAAASTATGGAITTYRFSFGDGTATVSGSSPTVVHAFAAPGTYAVSLVVSGNVGVAAGTTASIAVTPATVVARITAPAGAPTGTSVSFDGSTSTADAGIATFAWDFGDGSAPVEGASATAQHAYAHPGTYTVALTVTAVGGAAATATTHYTVSDRAPTALGSITTVGVVAVGDTVAFDGSSSSDPDGTVTGWAWTFGDGDVGAGTTPTHAYSTPGSYPVALRVTDNSGVDSQAVAVGSVVVLDAPNATFTLPSPQPTGQSAHFNAGGSTGPEPIVAYTWDFGDGSPTASGVSAAHAYVHAGAYTVTLTIRDAGGRTRSLGRTMTILDRPPVIVLGAGPFSVVVGRPLVLDASGSGDPDGSIAAYAWAFGDGSTSTLATPSHTWSHTGTYRVTLHVVDDSGSSATVARVVHVTLAPACVVPDLRGRTLARARLLLRTSHCALGRVRRIRSARPKGTVIRSSPTGGSHRHPVGTRVAVVVSRGPK